MKIMLSLIVSLLLIAQLSAAPVSEQTANNLAQKFFRDGNTTLSNQPVSLLTKELIVSEKITSSFGNQTSVYYYIYNHGDNGFLIIAGDDAVTPILGYSHESVFDTSNVPPNLAEWLEGYKAQIKSIAENKVGQTPEISTKWYQMLYGSKPQNEILSSVEPLIKTKWGQKTFYNYLCPYDKDAQSRTLAGCGAISMAQIMKYWNFPEAGKNQITYSIEKYGKLYANFSESFYNWESMPISLTAPNFATAKLISDCGISVNMIYSVEGSGTYTISLVNALNLYFSYSDSIELIYRSSKDEQWIGILKKELLEGRPINYTAAASNYGGHSFICDGFDYGNDTNDIFFHFNWGWEGTSDGYFHINKLNPRPTIDPFQYGHQAIIGIKPSSTISKNNLEISESISLDSNKIQYGKPLNVTTKLINNGDSDFMGEYAAVYFDKNNNFVEFQNISPPNEFIPKGSISNQLNFHSNGSLTLLAGDYNVKIYCRSPKSYWQRAIGTNKNIREVANVSVINTNPIKIISRISHLPNTSIFQENPLTIKFDIINTGVKPFKGYYTIELFDSIGTFVKIIDSIPEAELQGNSSIQKELEFKTVSLNVELGKYYLVACSKSNEDKYKYIMNFNNGIENPIKIEVVEFKDLIPDNYEPNNYPLTLYFLKCTKKGNIIKTKTINANLHSKNDIDYYGFTTFKGFTYRIKPTVYDINNSDGSTYTLDAGFRYSTDIVNWSEVYDITTEDSISLSDNQRLYIQIVPIGLQKFGTYSLAIEGTETPNSTIILDISTAQINFESVKIGQSKTKSVMLRNPGETTLAIDSVRCAEGFSCSQTAIINPQDSIEFFVKFSPNTMKSYIGYIDFFSNAAKSHDSIHVYGLGTIANSVPDDSKLAHISIHPNPASDVIMIDFQNSLEEVESVIINDVLGNIMFDGSGIGQRAMTIDVSNYESGVYFLSIKYTNGTIYRKNVAIIIR